MATIRVTIHGTQVGSGDPLIYTQRNVTAGRDEVAKSMSVGLGEPGCIAFHADNGTVLINKMHIAMIEVTD